VKVPLSGHFIYRLVIHLDAALKMRTIALIMRAQGQSLADVLFGQGRGAVLALLYGHPDQSFYYRQIVRQLASLSSGTIQRELDVLSRVGLIKRSATGNQVFYSANTKHPVFSELRSLVSKTVGAIQVLKLALSKLSQRIAIAFVYGSMARQEEKAESDIDLMVIGTAKLEEVLEAVDEVESLVGRAVNPTVYSVREFKKKIAEGNHFLTAVLRGEKLFLIGDEDELTKMGRVRVAESRID
jgi:uncharacterized protein